MQKYISQKHNSQKHTSLSYESSFAYFPLSWMCLCCDCSSLLSAYLMLACSCNAATGFGPCFWIIRLESPIYQIRART